MQVKQPLVHESLNHRDLASHDGQTARVEEWKPETEGLLYAIDETPPWFTCILLGLQVRKDTGRCSVWKAKDLEDRYPLGHCSIECHNYYRWLLARPAK